MQIRSSPRLEFIPWEKRTSFVIRRFRLKRLDFNWHYHPEIELTLIVRGSGLRYVGHSIHPFSDGDLCLLGPNLPHSWVTGRSGSTALESLVIQFKAEFIEQALQRLPEMESACQCLKNSQGGICFEGRIRDELRQRMLQLYEMREDDPVRVLRLLEILHHAARFHPRSRLSSQEALYSMRPEVARRIRRVISYVEQHLRLDISHGRAAAVAGMAPTAFSRFFRQHVGKTFEDYVNEARLGEVCAELEQSDDSITEIALRNGFQNLSNFNRRFQQKLHMTPRVYRTARSQGG